MSEQNLLKTLTLGFLVYDKRDLISVPASTSVDQALVVLQRENVLSLPVSSDSNPQEFIGMISIFDIMTYVAFGSFRVDEASPDQFQLFRSAEVPVSDLLALHSESGRIWALNESDPIEACLEPMSKGIHRIIVRGSSLSSARLLTQSDVLRFLMAYSIYGRRDADGTADANKSLSDLHLLDSPNKPPLIVVPSTFTTLEAFRTLEQHGITAAPVVDDQSGVIVTTISASDLRGLRSHQLSSILLPVTEFLKKLRHGVLQRPITAVASQSLYDVSTLMIMHRIHRVWVVDNDKKPIGVVSMSDVVCKFSPYDFLV